jgi:hypothetical protein
MQSRFEAGMFSEMGVTLQIYSIRKLKRTLVKRHSKYDLQCAPIAVASKTHPTFCYDSNLRETHSSLSPLMIPIAYASHRHKPSQCRQDDPSMKSF